MKYKTDVVHIWENSIILNGWVIGESLDSRATFRVEDEKHKPAKFKHVNTRRDDVSQIHFKKVLDREFGFDIQFPYEQGKDHYPLIHCEGRQAKVKYNKELVAKRASVAYKRMEKLKDLMNTETVHVATELRKEHGLKALVVRSKHKLQGIDNDYGYSEWYELTKLTNEELVEQGRYIFDFEPMLPAVIPAYKTPECYLRGMLDSTMEQTYTNWEICVADGSPRGEGPERVLKKYADRDRRVCYEILDSNRGTSSNTDAVLDMARGDFATLADHDDTLPPNAFYEMVKAINENPDCQVIYSDEDKPDMDGKALFDPHFKPDFNPDLLTSVNYIRHLLVIRQDLLKQADGFHQEFDGVQDYDLVLRRMEAVKRVYHIPKVLYHWRCYQNSTAGNPESKMYAFETGSRAIMAHCERMGIPAVAVEKGVDYGTYHTTFEIQGEPLVSAIVPNRDHSQDPGVCVRSPMEKSPYRNLEFIIMENNSSQKETFVHYDRVQAEHNNFWVVTWKEDFNYFAINNYGVSSAKSEYPLLPNNDTELIDGDSIKEMLGSCQREDMGIMGVRPLHGDDTIQHARAVIDFGGIAGHTFIGLHETGNSYFHGAMCAQDYSIATAVYLMTKKSVFDQVGGLSSELVVALNDIDYCMRVRALGRLVVYAPYLCFYHYEPKSRGLEDTPEKVARFNREMAISIQKWLDIIQNGDPCYNPNLTLYKSNSTLRDPLKEETGGSYDLKIYQRFAPEDDTKAYE